MYVCTNVCAVSEIFGLALQFTSQNCLDCYSKLNLGIEQISRTSCYSSPSYKIKNTTYFEYYIIIISTRLLQTATQFTI